MITCGTILISHDAPRPAFLAVETDSYPAGWLSVARTLTRNLLDARLAAAGWTLFYLAIVIRKTAFGFNREAMTHLALQRVIAKVSQQRCNCLEVDEVSTHSFLGIPYIRVSAHARHIQQGIVFCGQ